MNSVRRTLRMNAAIPLLCLVLPIFVSCSTFSEKKNDESHLAQNIEAFNSALRWEEYKLAAAMLPPHLQDEFWRQADAVQGHMRIMDFEIRNILLEQGGFYGTAMLRFRYYYRNDPQVRTKTLRQQWRFLEKEKTWQVVQFNLDELMADQR